MALLQLNFYSNALARTTVSHVILPNDVPEFMIGNNVNYQRATKALYLLHGFSGNSSDWITGSQIQELAVQYNLAIVMPSGENSFYLNGKGTGRAYADYVGKELVAYVSKTFGFMCKFHRQSNSKWIFERSWRSYNGYGV